MRRGSHLVSNRLGSWTAAAAALAMSATGVCAAEQPAPGEVAPAGGTPATTGSDAAPRVTKQVPGRFTVQLPANMFAFGDEAAERNRLTATHLKAAINGVVISILASKAAAGELDGAVQKAVALVAGRPGLREIGREEISYAGRKGYKYIFSGDAKDKPTLYFSYLLRDDERVYVFTASVFTAHRKEFEGLFDQIAQSIAKDSATGGGGATDKPNPAPTDGKTP